MGARLSSDPPALPENRGLSGISDAVVRGDIQVDGNGTPTVLLADHQPTGGYPRIATIITADFERFAQLPAKARFQFRLVDQEEAVEALKTRQTEREALPSLLQPVRIDPAMDESLRVRFRSLDDYALTVEVNGYVSAADFAEFLGIQEEILLQLIEIVKSSGSDFAFPSSTTYFARDTGLDQDLARQAEQRAVEARAGNDPTSVPEGFEADLFRQLRPHSDGIDRDKPSAA